MSWNLLRTSSLVKKDYKERFFMYKCEASETMESVKEKKNINMSFQVWFSISQVSERLAPRNHSISKILNSGLYKHFSRSG